MPMPTKATAKKPTPTPELDKAAVRERNEAARRQRLARIEAEADPRPGNHRGEQRRAQRKRAQ
jgi:hypothetical protein